MNFFRVLLLTLLAGLYLSSPVYAEPSWTQRARGTWEWVKNIGNRSMDTAEVVAGEKKFPIDSKLFDNKDHEDGDRGKGWQRAQNVGGKSMGSERSRHNRVDGEKSWKKEKKHNDNDHSKSRNKD